MVDAAAEDEVLAVQFGLDHVVHLPEFTSAIHLDGPLAGQTGYAIDELGRQSGFALAPGPGGLSGTYEVAKVSEDGRPAELRLAEVQQESTATAPQPDAP